jgi:hypothetical protein
MFSNDLFGRSYLVKIFSHLNFHLHHYFLYICWEHNDSIYLIKIFPSKRELINALLGTISSHENGLTWMWVPSIIAFCGSLIFIGNGCGVG